MSAAQRYALRIWGKYTAKWGVQMAGMNFQTRSGIPAEKLFWPFAYPKKTDAVCNSVLMMLFIVLLSNKLHIIVTIPTDMAELLHIIFIVVSAYLTKK